MGHLRLGLNDGSGHRRHLATEALGELGPELLVLLDEPVELRLDLIEESVDLLFVVSRP
jgi:hypothetical protein